METKVPTSGYLEEKYCEQLRELLRDAMQRHEKDKPLPKFYATHQEYERKMFAIIDNAKMATEAYAKTFPIYIPHNFLTFLKTKSRKENINLHLKRCSLSFSS